MKTKEEIIEDIFGKPLYNGCYHYPELDKLVSLAMEAYHEDKTRWVECSERLPEMGYIVSTYSKYYGVNNAVWIQKGVWKSNVNNQEYQGVTHWQPLPTPPKINNHEKKI